MLIKTVINPKYDNLKDFINNIPDNFESEGKCIYKARNEVKIFDINAHKINVKSYKIPIWINRFIYKYFRTSKAFRAYNYAINILKKGIETPEPIAYIEIFNHGLLSNSYFISIHSGLESSLRIFNDNDKNNDGKEEFIKEFARYTAKLHDNKILHIDYSPGNILVGRGDNGYIFSLIDINRMKFCNIDITEGCKNFRRISGNKEFFEIIANEYALARGFDPVICTEKILYYKSEEVKRNKNKKKRKALIKI